MTPKRFELPPALIELLIHHRSLHLITIPPLRPVLARLMVERGFSPLFYITSRAEKKRNVFRQLEGVAFCTHDSMELVMTDPEEEYGDVVFQKKIQPEKKIIAVLEVGDLSREIIDPGLFSDHSLLLIGGQQYPRERMIEQLFEMKYERKEHVREKGDLAIRGEILDVFPPQLDAPIRTYWMGNVIEKIKYFLPDTQRTTDSIDRCLLIPREGTFKTFPFLGLLKEKAGILFWDDVLIENQDLASIPQVISGIITPQGPTTTFQFPAERPPSFQGDISSLLSFLKQDSGNTVYIVLPGEKGKNLASILQEEKISYSREISGEPRIIQLDGFPCEGFVCDELGMTLLSHREIFGKDILKPGKRKPETRSPEEVIRSLQEGDFVVHEDQGIGIFRGMKEIVVEGVHRVYLVIEYAAGDILYVPVDHVTLVQKYVGTGDAEPKISRLGKDEWSRAKQKVAKSIKEVASELLEIYARRRVEKGYAFPPDTTWQKQMELAFPYVETPDQKKAIEDVRYDMELVRPMDRLICGDVGYGKTEIAIRAAFKAVMGGKQVAILAPTTILSEQHFVTFRDRLKGFPVRIEVVNRFRTSAEQKQIVEQLHKGEIDILIGTHRLLQKDILFHDLGLVVVDEEQRFGVMHKERLKKMKSTVDVLTLTATPIPRTLYLSLTGIRDISVIDTPPEGRKPVHSVVAPRSPKMIREAIEYELTRGGQVFYVCPRIKNLLGIREELESLLPGRRLAVAHGRLSGPELERVMGEFYDGKIEILLCTTIIEIGLDIPNANTLIVDPTTFFGLSQLYQLRGRIGRFDREAFAYFFYPRKLTHEAQERLDAILEFGELGSGYKLAIRDMEIRGAGNIIGEQQHGFIQEIGFSLYNRMLQDEIARMKGEKAEDSLPPSITLREEAYLPVWYMGGENERFSYYQRFLAIRNFNDLTELQKELEDRFGHLPQEVKNLIKITKLRYYGKIAQVEDIEEKNGELYIVAPLDCLVRLGERFRARGWKGILTTFHSKPALKMPLIGIDALITAFDPDAKPGFKRSEK